MMQTKSSRQIYILFYIAILISSAINCSIITNVENMQHDNPDIEEFIQRNDVKTPSQSYVTVDPIDGTTNLVRGVPFYCSSIAVSYEPTISAVHSALVTDLFHDITYTAMAGKGSYRNGSKIGTSQVMSMEEAVIGLDLNTLKVREIDPQITNLIQNTKHIRHFGANALEICYVADGTTDAFVDIRGKLRTTDMAASYLIAKEAGGVITKPNGSEFDAKLSPKTRVAFIVAGNHSIHNTILDYLTAI